MKNTKDKILKTAERLYNQLGLESVSIRGIASEMGISHGNLMYHFENKETLTRALLQKSLNRFEAILLNNRGSVDTEFLEFCIKHRWIWCGKRELKHMGLNNALQSFEQVERKFWEKIKTDGSTEIRMWLTEAWLLRIPIGQKSGFENHISSFEEVLSELNSEKRSSKSKSNQPSPRKKGKTQSEDRSAAQGSLF